MRNRFRVLYVAPHGLGDLIMSLRAMEFLAAQGARTTVLVKSRSEANYLRHTSDLVFDEILVLDTFRKHGNLLGNARLAWNLLLARYSAAVPQMNVNIKQFDIMLRSAGVSGRRKSVEVLREATALGGPFHSRHKVDLNVDMAAQILGVSRPSSPAADIRAADCIGTWVRGSRGAQTLASSVLCRPRSVHPRILSQS